MNTLMWAAAFTEFGGPEVLKLTQLPRPEPGEGQVRVQVMAATVNPADTVRRSGGRAREMSATPGPYVIGMEFSGVLDSLGPGVHTDIRVGERVMGVILPTAANGAYAESVIVPVESIVRSPRGIDHVAAAIVPMNGLSAQMSLDLLDLTPGQTLAVTGAAGAYGGYAIQLAKAQGLRVVADASPQDRPLVRRLGADIVVERGQDVAQRILEQVPGGVDGLADGAVLNDLVAPAVRDGGRIVTVRFFNGAADRSIWYRPLVVRDYFRDQKKLDELRVLVEEGRLIPRVAASYPINRAAEAHRRLEAGGTRGRLVLTFPPETD